MDDNELWHLVADLRHRDPGTLTAPERRVVELSRQVLETDQIPLALMLALAMSAFLATLVCG
jgi:hypothetical protein